MEMMSLMECLEAAQQMGGQAIDLLEMAGDWSVTGTGEDPPPPPPRLWKCPIIA